MNTTTMSNSLDPDQARDVGPDLDLKSLQSEKRDGTSRAALTGAALL